MHFVATILLSLGLVMGKGITKVEPPCWWTNMETPLTLMVYGDNITGSNVTVNNADIVIKQIHNADSPNYLFIDLELGKNLTPGNYTFTIERPSNKKKLKFEYPFLERRKDSKMRESYGPGDVIYLLVADRFANGDLNNDSSPATIEKANRENPGGRHGGDLQGIIDHLDYIADLGATTIWPIPLTLDNQSSYTYHGYSVSDYYMIDPRYGSNELYRHLSDEAHSKGLKLIQDLVVNHCGLAHWWMKDLPFKDWTNHYDTYVPCNWAMSTHSDPHTSQLDLDGCTQGWFDRSMVDMNLCNPYTLQYLTQMAIWWVEYANLDGLRVDTYPYSDKNAISQWTLNILKEYPNLSIVGECWFGSPQLISYWEGVKKSDGTYKTNNDGFTSHLPMVMDFPLMGAIAESFVENDSIPRGDNGVRKIYNSLSLDYAYYNPNHLLVFMSNHDTFRPAQVFGITEDPVSIVLSRMKNAYTFLLTTRGVPQIYYGDEVMMHSADGTTGHSQERADFPGGWQSDKNNAFTAEGRTQEQNELFNHVRKLLNWRKTSPAVTDGKLTHFLPQPMFRSNVYVYFRYTDTDRVMVIINNGNSSYQLDWNYYKEMLPDNVLKGKEILSDRDITIGDKLCLPAMSSAVIVF